MKSEFDLRQRIIKVEVNESIHKYYENFFQHFLNHIYICYNNLGELFKNCNSIYCSLIQKGLEVNRRLRLAGYF